MKELWLNMKDEDIWKFWDGIEVYEALYNRTGILDNSPLRNTLQRELDKFNSTLKRKLVIGAMNVEKGVPEVIDFDNLTVDEYADAIVASSAVPVLFPFSDFKG